MLSFFHCGKFRESFCHLWTHGSSLHLLSGRRGIGPSTTLLVLGVITITEPVVAGGAFHEPDLAGQGGGYWYCCYRLVGEVIDTDFWHAFVDRAAKTQSGHGGFLETEGPEGTGV